MSQLLERLQRELAQLDDPVAAAETRARIAANLARLGRFDAARKAIDELRQIFGAGQSGRATVWIMLAEGLIQHYEDLSPTAIDRITRAQVLGVAMGYSTVIALASAWKAHIEFETSNFSAMIGSLSLATQNVGEAEHDAQTRLAIVLSNSFMICGDRVQGQKWFMRGREHAVKNGDQASIEALLYNRVAFTLAWFRVLNCGSGITAEELKRLRLEIDSARNLQDLTRITALANHVKLLDARLMILEGRYEDAIFALGAIRTQLPFAQHNFDQLFIDLEIFFCRIQMDESATPGSSLDILVDRRLGDLDIDERIVAAWMRFRIAEVRTDMVDMDVARRQLSGLMTKYQTERAALGAALENFILQ